MLVRINVREKSLSIVSYDCYIHPRLMALKCLSLITTLASQFRYEMFVSGGGPQTIITIVKGVKNTASQAVSVECTAEVIF